MPEASAAIPAGVNVLLRVLTCEIHVMAHLALGLASCAGVAIRNVETARVARIPICKPFDNIGVRGVLLLLLSTLGRVSRCAALWGKVIHAASTAGGWGHRIGRWKYTAHALGCRETAWGILLLRAAAASASVSTSTAAVSLLLVRWIHRGDGRDGGIGTATSSATTTANTLSGIAGVEG